MDEVVHAWCLVNGSWVEREDPVMAGCDPYGGDVRTAVAALGYEVWCRVGELPLAPMSLTLYSREAPPLQYLLQLEGNAGDVVEHIFAESLPDAMELLARWTPVARCAYAGAGGPENLSGPPPADPRGPVVPRPVSPAAAERLASPQGFAEGGHGADRAAEPGISGGRPAGRGDG
jgi:hypothetical protein